MNKWLELLVGLILILVPIWVWIASAQWGAFWDFGIAAWAFLKGAIIWGVLLIGLLFIMLGISDLKG